uniref:nuclear respiratory factor 1-like n=1 Tax=Myxine glutinosa TaxID=7769 RepID=UPI00358ED388
MDSQSEELGVINGHHEGDRDIQEDHLAGYSGHAVLEADDSTGSSADDDAAFDDSDILISTVGDDVTAHLASAGPVGMAAAAAVASGKKRKRPHIFESNPSIRKRQQTRLLRKLRNIIDEYATRVGQQAIVLCVSPCKPNPIYKVFGSAPLESVVRKYKGMVLNDLEISLAEHTPSQPEMHSDLPPLTIDGIPVSVDKMTQAQLRAFIPEMLKFSTSRGKPGWGKEACRPIWWPDEVPWANVRSDVRTEDQKQQISWTYALRTIVKNCYKHHGREDLLYPFEDVHPRSSTHSSHTLTAQLVPQAMVQAINSDGMVSLIQVDAGTVAALAEGSELPQTVTVTQVNYATVERDWAGLHGTEMSLHGTHEASHAVATLAEVAAATQRDPQTSTVTMAINSDGVVHAVTSLGEATIQEGQLVLSGDGTAITGVQDVTGITIPVRMYPTIHPSLSSGERMVTMTPTSSGTITTKIEPDDSPMDTESVAVVTLSQT